jgi:penicillin-binding protein 1A
MTKKAGSFRKYIYWFWLVFTGLILFTVILFYAIAKGWLGFMPSFEELENPETLLATEVYSTDNKIIGNYWYLENRMQVSYDQFPPHLVQALIATEDARFYKHSGIDVRGIARMVKGILTGNSSLGGGSTISQQLAKMLFPRKEFSNKFAFAVRKFKEWVIAVKLEKSYTKEEIITMYLNKYDFLNNAVGIKSAARIYFNTEPALLTIEQSAMLIGMAKNSALYNPVRRPELVLDRRNVVFGQMKKYGYISGAEYQSLVKKPLGLDYHKADLKGGLAPYFREYLRLTMTAVKPDPAKYASWQHQKFVEDSTEWETNPLYGWCNKNLKPNGEKYNIYRDGLRIYTTIDSRMQQYAEEAVKKHLGGNLQPKFDSNIRNLPNAPFSNDMTKQEADSLLNSLMKQTERYRVLKEDGKSNTEIIKNFKLPVDMTIFSWRGDIDTLMSPLDSIRWYLRFFKSSFMATDTKTGQVRAYVGGPDYRFFMYDMVTLGKRQVGSTVKPFLYTLAMQNGYSPCTRVPYVSQQFKNWDGSIYEPEDSEKDDDMLGQMVTLKWGLANSRNKISAWVMKQFSPEAMAEMMRKFGIYSPIDPQYSMFMGTSDITLYEMVGAFATYANKGVFTKPYFVTKIEDRFGNVVATFQPAKHDVIDENTAYLMLNMLQAVVNEGTGGRLRNNEEYGQFTMPIAGKTGTTQNHSDGWFIGVTPDLTAGVWTGADLRSVHFRDLTLGQGANMALPVWGYFMKKVLADPTLHISEYTQFERPANFNVNLDCGDSEQNSSEESEEFF